MPFPIIGLVANILISLALTVVSYVLTPRPKQPKPESFRDLENPTAEAGREVPVVFGTVTIKDPNILWYGDKESAGEDVSA